MDLEQLEHEIRIQRRGRRKELLVVFGLVAALGLILAAAALAIA